MSTALWGIIVSIKFNKKSVFNIFTDFFNFKKSVKSYLLVFGFIILLFGPQFAQNQINDNVYWYTFVILFLQSIIFGGIEEIGWRYTWQPIIEKKYSFVISCITTFFSWSLWHYMYFYITDSITSINHPTFLIGLLGSCFILGAIYKISQNLWLCVLYHCLLNMFSQTFEPSGLISTINCNGLAIVLSLVLVKKYPNNQVDI